MGNCRSLIRGVAFWNLFLENSLESLTLHIVDKDGNLESIDWNYTGLPTSFKGTFGKTKKVSLKFWNKGLPKAILATPSIVDSGEFIFDNKYIYPRILNPKSKSYNSCTRDLCRTFLYKKAQKPISLEYPFNRFYTAQFIWPTTG
jgi:hypothetical protein